MFVGRCSKFYFVYLIHSATLENACELFENGPKLLGDEEFGLNFIRDHMDEVLQTEGFLQLSPSRLKYLLKDDSLCLEEVNIFRGLREWAKARIKKDDDLKGNENDKIAEIMKPYIQDIRFPLMDMEDLATYVSGSKIVSEKDLLLLYQYCAMTDEEKSKKETDLPFNCRMRAGGKRLKFANIMDTNGLFYFIGTNGGKSSYYSNPAKNGQVVVRLSSTGVGATVDHVADRDPSLYAVENNYGSERNPWISVEFKKYLLRPTEYVICQEQDHFLQNWRLEGREKGKTEWLPIQEHKNDTSIASKVPHRAVFKVKSTRFYQEFRIYVTGPSHKGQTNFDITQLEFYGYYREIK